MLEPYLADSRDAMIQNGRGVGLGKKRLQESTLAPRTAHVLMKTAAQEVWLLLSRTRNAKLLNSLRLEPRPLGSNLVASVWSQANHLYSLSPILLMCRRGMVIDILSRVGVRIDRAHLHQQQERYNARKSGNVVKKLNR